MGRWACGVFEFECVSARVCICVCVSLCLCVYVILARTESKRLFTIYMCSGSGTGSPLSTVV